MRCSPYFLPVGAGVLLTLVIVAMAQTKPTPAPMPVLEALNANIPNSYMWADSTGPSITVHNTSYDKLLEVNGVGGSNLVTIYASGQMVVHGDPTEAAKIFWTNVASLMAKDRAFETNRVEMVQLLKECHELMAPKYSYTLEYVSPADQLRRQAARIEYQDDVIKRLKTLLSAIGELPQ